MVGSDTASDSLELSYLPDPTAREDWPIIEAMLAPASETDVFDPAIDVCWIAYEGNVLLGAFTTRLTTDGIAHLRLVGGHEFRRWFREGEEMVTEWARAAGASRLVARGRMGWRRVMPAGWVSLGTDDEGKALFSKDL